MKFIDLFNITTKIHSSEPHHWKCYGEGAMYLFLTKDSFSEPSFTCVVNDEGELCESTSSFVDGDEVAYAYRWVNPKYESAMIAEHEKHGLDYRIAWENVIYTECSEKVFITYTKDLVNKNTQHLPVAYSIDEEDLDHDDFFDSNAPWVFPEDTKPEIVSSCEMLDTMNQYPDGNTTVAINIDNDLLFKSFMIAHEKNITFNQYVNDVLLNFIDTTKGIDAQY